MLDLPHVVLVEQALDAARNCSRSGSCATQLIEAR